MAKATKPKEVKGLNDAEMIAKYEAGKQPISDMISTLLSKPAKNAPPKIQKRP
jgi:hypothetical protein